MVKIVYGGAAFWGTSAFNGPDSITTVAEVVEVLDALEELGVKNIDTAEIYGKSEELLGEAGAAKRFVIDTKIGAGFKPEPATKDGVIQAGKESLKKLKTEQVDIYYIHAPERRVPLEETLAGIDTLHKADVFKRFGLSNFLPSEVEDVVRIAKEHNFVAPTVYQGSYSAIARRQESELFPILRKHNIAFYAYSPVSGGFLTKSPQQILEASTGRWDPTSGVGKQYHALYNKPSLIKALQIWDELSNSTGIPKAELAYRWVAHNSALREDKGDAIIVGASKLTQLRETVAALKKGPLSKEVVEKVDEIWALAEKESPLDNFNK
ncbi:NADP-dependent oxidoreductase domain-containing protein [Fimicolochytrium jonesii]|uniref:NADP-dependent oxidoreductase domain-containing protein n=1 Tax=Fimicolochytrium jonesii TaxID=1396493 RepID=UPI0022FED9B8|nr:NADP-dependent oxidoreductase domain-containing protein [Fimicolochytrium jonesii]KAI8816307.1 NADP-dependent oxidoreductase domain-containing protein [Fimicolochytrium jonesii]